MAAPGHSPTRFHRVHGANVRLDASRTRATRVESFANALCFSHEPLAPGQIFLVEIEEKELGWCGHLRVGLTAHDPQSLGAVPEYSLPDLVSLGDTWVFAITRSHNRVSVDGQEEPAPAPAPLWEPELRIDGVRIPRDKLVGRSRPGRYSHLLDELYRTNVLPPTALRSRIGVLYAPRPDGTADMHIVINGEDMGPSARSLPTARPLYAVIDVFASTKSVRVIQVEYGCGYLHGDPAVWGAAFEWDGTRVGGGWHRGASQVPIECSEAPLAAVPPRSCVVAGMWFGSCTPRSIWQHLQHRLGPAWPKVPLQPCTDCTLPQPHPTQSQGCSSRSRADPRGAAAIGQHPGVPRQGWGWDRQPRTATSSCEQSANRC